MDVPTAYRIRITVVNDNVVNAFALPGGRIVVYTALLKQIKSYPELAALLSHEFTHINNKHSTKSIFRRLGSKVFIGLLFGRFGTVTSVLVNHADNLKSLTYSAGIGASPRSVLLSMCARSKTKSPDSRSTEFVCTWTCAIGSICATQTTVSLNAECISISSMRSPKASKAVCWCVQSQTRCSLSSFDKATRTVGCGLSNSLIG